MIKLWHRWRARRQERFAAEYPVSAWVTSFKTEAEFKAALERGEGPR